MKDFLKSLETDEEGWGLSTMLLCYWELTKRWRWQQPLLDKSFDFDTLDKTQNNNPKTCQQSQQPLNSKPINRAFAVVFLTGTRMSRSEHFKVDDKLKGALRALRIVMMKAMEKH